MLAVRYSLLADVARDIAARPKEGDADLTPYAGACDAAYKFQDSMLARLLQLAGPETRVLLIAPYAQAALRRSPSDPWATRHGQGMMLASGPGFVRDALLQGATLHDIFPTILQCFGLSAPSSGAVLRPIFSQVEVPLRSVSVPPPSPEPQRSDPAIALIALGYADTLSSEQAAVIADAELTAQVNLGESLLARGEWRRAADSFETVLLRRPDHYEANVKLGHALLQLGDTASARPIAETVLAMAPNLPWGYLLVGVVLMLEGDLASAAAHFERARELGRNTPVIVMRIAWINLLLSRGSDAESGFRAVLAHEPRSAEALTGLGISLEQQDRYGEAERALRAAIALEFFSPIAHLHLGQVLAKRGNDLEAMKALRTALAQQPESPDAKSLLAALERRFASGLAAQLGANLSRQP
jgi:Flp pilus assembly protein TadD